MLKGFEEQHKAKLAELDQKQNQGSRIKNVWIYNLDTELDKISQLLEEFPFVSMDTEFPGTCFE